MIFKLRVNKTLRSSRGFLVELFDEITGQVGRRNIRKSLVANIDQIVIETLNDVVLPAMRENLEKNKSNYTNTLTNSLEFISDQPGRVVLSAGAAESYARILERGTAPRIVDQEEAGRIFDWVVIKKKVTPDKAVTAAGFVIKHIQEKGNTPHEYIKPAIEQTMPTVQEIVRVRLAEVLGVS